MKTLGEFYREKILSQKNLITKELPDYNGEVKIEKGLFGWKLHSGKNYIECESEEEARYLKIFLEAGLTEVKIPKDKKYLKKILPEIEKLKEKIDEIINSSLESIMDKKIQEKVKSLVWSEIIK